jgi:hypothetical protein
MNMRILGTVAVAALSCPLLLGAPPAKPAVTPIQAELIADMHARLLKPGGAVFARVTADWHSTECALNIGSTLEGHVVEVVPHVKVPKGTMPKASTVSIAFTKAQCGGPEMHPYSLLLSAMAAPPHDEDMGIMSDMLPVMISGPGQPGALMLEGMHTAGYMNYDFQSELPKLSAATKMQIGYVSGIRGLKLSVGTGDENSTVLTEKDHDVSLEKHTLILLIPTEGTIPRMVVDPNGVQHLSVSASDADAAKALPPPVDDVDLCKPPQCSEALPSGDSADTPNAATTFSIQQLGYTSRPQREMAEFDHDEELAYLGPHELLVAFNPHKLVARHALGRSGATARVIRAAVMNTETHQITHSVEWELPDERQYLWPLTDGRVLVHVGSELRVYGAGLKVLSRLPLDGPLAYVRVTPDGNFIAAGVVHERHSSELHAQLAQSLGREPEEDIHVVVLNRNFEVIAKSAARSYLMAPTLLNEGQVLMRALPNSRYRITMQAWNGQAHQVAQFESSCTPALSSIAPDLLFLVSCAKQTEGREYRVLRTNGKLVLKGDSTLSELGHGAEGIGKDSFVVKTVQSTLPAPPGATFRADQFASEELRVYRAADGKRLLGVRVAAPTASQDGYALSPDGSQLAVLNRDSIAVYAVPAK